LNKIGALLLFSTEMVTATSLVAGFDHFAVPPLRIVTVWANPLAAKTAGLTL
jgi:hypothetical protein